MSFSGDIGGLRGLAGNLAKLAKVPSQAATEAAEKISASVQAEYDKGQDAYGKTWAALKPSTLKKGRRPPPLTNTGAMRSSTEVKPMAGAGIAITFGVPYAIYHHTGTRYMAARPVAPTEGQLPPEWNELIGQAMENAADRNMGGR